jgi:NADH-quinone oxidoreductase subunit L
MLSEMPLIQTLVHLIWIIPLLGSITIVAMSHVRESLVSRVISVVSALCAMASVSVLLVWILQPSPGMCFRPWAIPGWIPGHLEFLMRMDITAVVFVSLTTFFQVIIIRFSRVYLHREEGYHRFFALIFLLTAGMQILSLADNLEIFFVGWEFIGLASFFLVAFYRHQERTASNALKIIGVYRIGDLGLVMAMVMFHLIHGMHPETRLSEVAQSMDQYLGQSIPADPLIYGLFLGLIVAAAAKSAQFPFTFWLPKAMEGPTPSSAIFYGALSVHAGALLMMRLYPLWSVYHPVAWVVGAVGLSTVIFGIGSGRVQTSIKGHADLKNSLSS